MLPPPRDDQFRALDAPSVVLELWGEEVAQRRGVAHQKEREGVVREVKGPDFVVDLVACEEQGVREECVELLGSGVRVRGVGAWG